MIRSISITGYRALQNFAMGNLGRVNLLVGKNNAGKSSVLEALYLLSNAGAPTAIWNVLMRRGESITEQPLSGRGFQPEIEIRRLFHGHVLKVGTVIEIRTSNGMPDRSIRFEIGEGKLDGNLALFQQLPQMDLSVSPQLAVQISGNPMPAASAIPLTGKGGLRADILQNLVNITAAKPIATPIGDSSLQGATEYVTTDALTIQEVQTAFNEISLSPREDRLIKALNFIDPNIERIAVAQGPFFAGPGWPTRGGLKVKLKNIEEPVPIGSMGEGIWRLLSTAIALSRAKDGIFLIDEIDTGLHFSMMDKLWRFIIETSREFNVQVFATTHSLDCVRSLASVCDDDESMAGDASIQRVQSNGRAVAYGDIELRALAHTSSVNSEVEVR